MKTEITPVSPMILDAPPGDSKSIRSRKRPRRSATMARSYVIPDSDDDAIAEVGRAVVSSDFAKKRRSETNLQRWIKHLSVLLKEEQRKVCPRASIFSAYGCSRLDSQRRRGNANKQPQNLVPRFECPG